MGLFSIFFFRSSTGVEGHLPILVSTGLCSPGPGGRAMTVIEMKADTSANRTGVYLAALQLVFTLGWTTYVIYLPKLAASVGIAPSAVILILMLDQAIFTISDTA